MKVSPGEISIGMDLTILDAQPIVAESVKNEEGNIVMQRLVPGPELLKGLPLKVEAIQLPYLVVRVVPTPQRTVIDTRLVTLMELSKEYAGCSVLAEQKQTPLQQGPGGGLAERWAKK